jgi:hypothetical protein
VRLKLDPTKEDQIDTALVTIVEISRKSTSLVKVLRRFALIHLETHTASKPPDVEYSQPTLDINVEFVKFCIQRFRQVGTSRSLDIMCSWAPGPDFKEESDSSNGHWRATKKGLMASLTRMLKAPMCHNLRVCREIQIQYQLRFPARAIEHMDRQEKETMIST